MRRSHSVLTIVFGLLLAALVAVAPASAAFAYTFVDKTPSTPLLTGNFRYPTLLGDGLDLTFWYEDRLDGSKIKRRTSSTGYTGFGSPTVTTGLSGLGHPRIYSDGSGGYVGYFWDTAATAPNNIKRLTSADGLAWSSSTSILIGGSPFPAAQSWGVVGYFENVSGSTDVLYFTQAIGANEQVYRATATNGIDFTYTGVAFVNPGGVHGAGVSVGSQVVFDAVHNQYTLIWSGESTVGDIGYAASVDGVSFVNQGTVVASNAAHNDLQESSFIINGSLLMGLYTGDFLPATANAIGVYIVADPPTATSVSPAVGPAAGGNTVTLTGTNLTGATAVTFGGVAATSYTIDSPTTITAVVPAHAQGAVDVQVTTPGGTTTLTAGYRYGTAPAITSADHTSDAVGQAMTPFTVTTNGSPNPTVTKSGALPAGVTFTDNGDGTATVAGIPTETGTFPMTITAANGVTPNATQNFTLTIHQAPAITSADHTSGAVGQAMTPFTVTTTGSPNPTVTKSGALPAGATFTDNGDGTATVAGTPTETGTFPMTITAANGVTPNATQNFTLTIHQAPAITSADHTSGAVGQAMTPFTVTTTGSPNPTVTKSGALPAGATFTDNGDGTATVAGTPTETGTFPMTITAANGVTPNATQNFTLTITAQPVVPVATTTTLTSGINPSIAGTPVSFGVSVSPAGASGRVTVSNGSTSVGSCTLSSGSCSVSTSALLAGSHSMAAVYEGDTTHTTSTSAVLTQAVAERPSATQTPGHGVLIVDGVEIPVTVEVTDDRSALIVSGPGVQMTVGAVDADGNRVPLSVTNNVAIARGGMIRMQGTGFAPGSVVTLVLFSEPRDLAQVTVNSKGSFSADVAIPDDVAAGTHTVQSVGQAASGSPMAMSLALTIAKVNKVVAQHPDKTLNLPQRVANKGWTRILRVPVRTNADQKAAVSVTCVRRHRSNEMSRQHSDACRVKRHAGVIRVWVSGDHGMKVRTMLQAPRTTEGVTTYRSYRKVKIYRTHTVPWLPTKPGTG